MDLKTTTKKTQFKLLRLLFLKWFCSNSFFPSIGHTSLIHKYLHGNETWQKYSIHIHLWYLFNNSNLLLKNVRIKLHFPFLFFISNSLPNRRVILNHRCKFTFGVVFHKRTSKTGNLGIMCILESTFGPFRGLCNTAESSGPLSKVRKGKHGKPG